MKRSSMLRLLAAIMLFIPCTVNAQEEYPNEGMPIRDLDGNVYRIIMTESGVWMAENLNTFKFNDGTPIEIVYDNTKWESIKTPARGFFKNTVEYAQTYGAIYNWYAVNTGKLCPKGWHVPTEAEWNDLMDYAGGSQASGDNPAKLKEAGTKHWKAPNEGATNEIFFTALPAGEISYFGTDNEPGTSTNWWTSTEDNMNLEPGEKATNASIVGLSYDFHSKTMGTYSKESALPVRCKMNDE
jgi:uncharacterized protein (TIGR02145 family)